MAGAASRRLVGRSSELAAVRRLVDGVPHGQGGVLLALGEAGIGKSRLLAEAAGRARERGLAVLAGRAVEGGGTYRAVAEAVVGHLRDDASPESEELRPYRSALGRLVPGWPAAGAGSPSEVDPTLVLGEGLLRLLRGSLLVLEDLHWADADTLALVEYLAGAARSWPLLVAASARDDEPTSGAVRLLAGRAEVTTLRLQRLDPEEVAALAVDCTGGRALPDAVRRVVVERSDGLPLLVEELTAAVLDAAVGEEPPAVPPSLAGLVARRLARLHPDQRRVLEAAAVVGAEPDWSVLAPVTGLPEAAVLGALRAAGVHLLVPDGDRLRWRHALTRDAVLATLLPPERAALARRAADVLLARGESEDDARAAGLLAAAGDRARSVALLVRLARRDLAAGALRSAEGWLDRAAAAGELGPLVAIERVRLLVLRGAAPAALEAGVGALAEAVGDRHAELCLQLAAAAVAAGRWAEAEGYVERAGRPDDPRSLVLAADAAFGAGDRGRAAALAGRAAPRAESAGRSDVRCEALMVLGRCALLGDAAAAEDAFRRAAQIAAEHGLLPWRVRALIGLATVQLTNQAVPPALAQARELAVDAGMLAQVVGADLLLTDCTFTVDGPRAAEPLARRTAAEAGILRLSGLQAIAELFVAGSAAVAGDRAAMDALLDGAAARPHVPVEVAVGASLVRALAHLLARDLRAAISLLDAGVAALAGHEVAAPVQFWGLWALLRTVAGDRDAEARAALRGSPAGRRAVNLGALRYAEAVAAGRAGWHDEAQASLDAADRTLADSHWWRRLLRLLALEAALNDGWGNPVPALRADLAVYERDGEHQLARTCRDLLRRAGAPTRRGRGSTPVPAELRALGVTAREMDVLALVVQGLTNGQIAARLLLSRRTVETHVANLLAKTGATGRAQLRSRTAPQTR